jgi:hypothetical protein
MLGGDNQFTLPSGYVVLQIPIEDGFTTVDLKNGGEGKKDIFKDVVGGDSSEIDQQKESWRQEGIRYIESADEAEKYRLRLPVHNMNDLLFAHLFQASNFGNWKIDRGINYGTTLIYAGYKEYAKACSSQIRIDGSNFLDGMTKLKEQAETQRRLGHRYMHVGTRSSTGGHAENIDITALLNLDLNKMETGKAYAIGDRNWSGSWEMSQDIPRLAVRKVDGTPPTYESGTLYGFLLKRKT